MISDLDHLTRKGTAGSALGGSAPPGRVGMSNHDNQPLSRE